MTHKIMFFLTLLLFILAAGSLWKWINTKYKRPPEPPRFNHEILELFWDNKDRSVASQVCRDRVLEKFTLRNLWLAWKYKIELRLYKYIGK